MDSFNSQSWANLGVTAKQIKGTPKAFYGKYLYRVELHIPCGYLIRDLGYSWGSKTIGDLRGEINELKRKAAIDLRDKSSSFSSSWRLTQCQEKMDANADQIWSIAHIVKAHKGTIRTRGEDSNFRIFTETEEKMFEILNSVKKYVKGHITEVLRPANDKAKLMLEDKVIFMKIPKFKYRVLIKGRKYSPELKEQILNYLSHYDITDYQLPFAVDHSLRSDNDRAIRGYYYVNDDAMLSFLRMISPNFVDKIFRIEQAL